MGLFDDLKPAAAAVTGPKGLFGDLVPAQNEAPKNPIADVTRQVGLTGRYALEGIPQTIDFLASPFKYATDKIGNALRSPTMNEVVAGKKADASSPTLSNMGTQLADYIGLPKPMTSQERVVGDVARTGFSVLGGAGGAKALQPLVNESSVGGKTLGMLAANPGAQTLSAAGAGGAAGVVRENGGSPVGQTIAALGAGILTPMAGQAVANAAKSVATSARGLMGGTQQLDVALQTELGKAGINWEELGANVKIQLREDAKKAIYSGQPIDTQALGRLADYRNIGATPLLGDITQQPGILTQQRNLAKQMANTSQPVAGQNLSEIDNDNAKRVLSTLGSAATSPLDTFATGERVINRVKGTDQAAKVAEDALYSQARDSAGRAIPLDRNAFVQAANSNLANSNRGSFLPPEVEKLLNQIQAGKMSVGGQEYPVPFNVDTIDQLKTVLASASRSTRDGNVKAAIAKVRDALESTGVSPSKTDFGGSALSTGPQAARMQTADALPAESMAAFDSARAAARGRRTWQESAPFIEDALNGGQPDAFVQKHVISAPVANLTKLRDEIRADPEATAAVKKQLIDYILKRGGGDADVTRFSSKGMEDGLKALGDRKLELFFQPEEIQQIKSAINVAKYMQAQPIGSAVGNSNSGAVILGKVSDMLTRLSDVPAVGPMVAAPLRSATLKVQSIPLRNLSSGLTAGNASALPGPRNSLIPLSALLAAPSVAQDKEK